MTISKKLETIYHNGQPDGIRSIRRNLSTMTTYVIPRPLLSEAKSISGITRPGIYYLINESDDNKIYDEIQFIMATQGYKMDDAKRTINEERILHTSRNGTAARGMYDGEKFEVLDGSEINMDKPAHLQSYNRLRDELLSKQSIVKAGEKYILNVTLDFNTPSGASNFVLGGSTNGWIEWKDRDGKTLDELFRKQIINDGEAHNGT